MIKSVVRVFLVALMLSPALVWAEAAPAAAASGPLKIAVLDAQRAVVETETAKAALTALQNQYKNDIEEGKKIEREMAAIQEKLQKEGDTMAAAQRTSLTRELREKEERRQALGRILQSAQQEKLQELFQQLGPKLQKAVQEVTSAGGFDLVLDARSVIMASAAIDITRKVTEKLNAGG